MNNAIKSVLDSIEVLRLIVSQFNANNVSALVRAVIIREYATRQGGNDKQDALFESEEFGQGNTYETTRHALIPVPKDITEDEVKARLQTVNGGWIMSIFSNDIMDVLTKNQIDLIGFRIENGKRVKLTEEETAQQMHTWKAQYEMQNKNGDCFLSKDGNFQFRRNFWKAEECPDIDLRESRGSEDTAYRNKFVDGIDYETGAILYGKPDTVAGEVDSVHEDKKPVTAKSRGVVQDELTGNLKVEEPAKPAPAKPTARPAVKKVKVG